MLLIYEFQHVGHVSSLRMYQHRYCRFDIDFVRNAESQCINPGPFLFHNYRIDRLLTFNFRFVTALRPKAADPYRRFRPKLEVSWPFGHVEDFEDTSQVGAGPQGPYIVVSRRQG